MTSSTQPPSLTSCPQRQYLAVVEPSAGEWDAFTLGHPQGHLLQSAGWGVLKQATGWRITRVLIVGPDGPLAGAQLLTRHRFGVSIAYVPRGPLFAADHTVNALLLATLERLARRSRALCLRLEPNVLERDGAARPLHELLLCHNFRPAAPIMPQSTIHLNLEATPEGLWAACSKGHRAAIRRARREGVTVRGGALPADLDAFHCVMRETSERANFGIYRSNYYETAWQQFGPTGNAQLLLAERGAQVLAAAFIFAWAGVASYLYGGSTAAGLECGANHALQWHAIEWARQHDCRLYDFWFVPDHFGRAAATAAVGANVVAPPHHPLDGVFRFKKSFGGRVVRYLPAYDRVYVPALYALLRRGWQA